MYVAITRANHRIGYLFIHHQLKEHINTGYDAFKFIFIKYCVMVSKKLPF